MRFAVYMAAWVITFLNTLLVLFCITVYMDVCFACFCLILYIMYSYRYVYVFLLLRMFRSGYSVSLCCSVYCLCVNVTVLLPPGVNPITVNKYISYHIMSYHIIYNISYHVISHHITSYHISCHIITYHNIS
jgi:hypothetical protein